jgi:hypothetical protein
MLRWMKARPLGIDGRNQVRQCRFRKREANVKTDECDSCTRPDRVRKRCGYAAGDDSEPVPAAPLGPGCLELYHGRLSRRLPHVRRAHVGRGAPEFEQRAVAHPRQARAQLANVD